jgi:hypothetical protein
MRFLARRCRVDEYLQSVDAFSEIQTIHHLRRTGGPEKY